MLDFGSSIDTCGATKVDTPQQCLTRPVSVYHMAYLLLMGNSYACYQKYIIK